MNILPKHGITVTHIAPNIGIVNILIEPNACKVAVQGNAPVAAQYSGGGAGAVGAPNFQFCPGGIANANTNILGIQFANQQQTNEGVNYSYHNTSYQFIVMKHLL
jgi:hypothetical protein